MNDFYLFLVFFLSALDACRDGFRADLYNGISNRGWHVIKWLSWYPLMIILALQMDFWYIVASPFVALIGWQFGLLWTPVKWKSQWVKWAVILWNKIKK
jgi:hypothetical protein